MFERQGASSIGVTRIIMLHLHVISSGFTWIGRAGISLDPDIFKMSIDGKRDGFLLVHEETDPQILGKASSENAQHTALAPVIMDLLHPARCHALIFARVWGHLPSACTLQPAGPGPRSRRWGQRSPGEA